MKPFTLENQKVLTDVTEFRETPSYIEIKQSFAKTKVILHAYIFLWHENTLLVSAYLGHDGFFQVLEQQLQDPKLGKAWYDTYKEIWPYTFQLVDHTIEGRYSQGALLKIQDPDDGDPKWTIATIVGNVDLSSVEKVQAVFQSETALVHEYLTREA